MLDDETTRRTTLRAAAAAVGAAIGATGATSAVETEALSVNDCARVQFWTTVYGRKCTSDPIGQAGPEACGRVEDTCSTAVFVDFDHESVPAGWVARAALTECSSS